MTMLFSLLFFTSAVLAIPPPLPQSSVHISAGSKPSSHAAKETVIISTKGKSTFTETFVATTLSKYSTITKPTTITTTDSKGAVALVEVFAGGLAWAAIPKVGPVPPIEPPPGPPNEPPATVQQTTKHNSKPSSSNTRTSRSLFNQSMVPLPDDTRTCGFGPKGPSVDGKTALEKIDTFCRDKNNNPISLGGINENFDMGAGIVLNLTASLASVCSKGDQEALDQGHCGTRLKEAISSCDKGSTKHGGTVKDGCEIYIAKPQEHEGDRVCNGKNGDSTGLNRDEALKNIKDFCTKNHGSNVSPNQGNSLQYHMALGNSQEEISVSYRASCPRGSSATYTIDETACNRFLAQTIDGCDTNSKPPYGKFGGNVTDHCGVFAVNTYVTDVISCRENPNIHFHAMTQKDVTNAINDYCEKDLKLDPNHKPDNSFHQTTPDGVSNDNYVKGLDNYMIRMQASFAGDHHEGCSIRQKFSTKGDECKRKLNSVIGKCGLKHGGSVIDTGPNGCVIWTIFGQGTSN